MIRAALICAWIGSGVMAQDYTALLDQSGQMTGVTDAIETPAFSVVIPVFGGDGPAYVSRVNDAPRNGIVTYTFATPDGDLIETVNLVNASLPMAAPDARLEQLATILNARTLPYLLQRFEQGKSAGLRPIEAAGAEAVELLGSYTHPEHGPMQWRLVGLPNPYGPDSLFALVQIASNQLPLPSVNSLTQTLTGRLLASLRFIPE